LPAGRGIAKQTRWLEVDEIADHEFSEGGHAFEEGCFMAGRGHTNATPRILLWAV
jgi:hypothetical protein